jgi:hypothetical protein
VLFRSGDYFFADEAGLDVVKESDSSEDKDLKAQIKAMRAWSKRFDNIVSKVFNKKKKIATNITNADEETLLRGGSGSSDSNKC